MKVILYFSDAFSWKYQEELDFMSDFWPERRPLRTILGYSSTILPVLVSGRRPAETGIWTEYYRADRTQTPLARLVIRVPPLLAIVNLARLVLFRFARKAGHPAAHKLRIPLQFAHRFVRHDMDYRRFPPTQLPVPTLDELTREAGLGFSFRYLKESYDLKAEVQTLTEDLRNSDVFFIYDPSVDGHGHALGADSEALSPDIERVESFVRQAYSSAVELDDDVTVLLFSDHGMTNVDAGYDIFSQLKRWKLDKDYLVFVDSTLARFWFTSPEIRNAIMSKLSSAPATWLTDEHKVRYGINFSDTRYGEEVLVIDEGKVFHPSYIAPGGLKTKTYPDAATHGYLPEVASAFGVYFRRGRGADSERTGPMPAEDIFSVVRELLETARPNRSARSGTGSLHGAPHAVVALNTDPPLR